MLFFSLTVMRLHYCGVYNLDLHVFANYGRQRLHSSCVQTVQSSAHHKPTVAL